MLQNEKNKYKYVSIRNKNNNEKKGKKTKINYQILKKSIYICAIQENEIEMQKSIVGKKVKCSKK